METTFSSRTSLTVDLRDSDITETVATRAKPIINADAAVAVRSGLLPAFLRAILLGTPSFAVGEPKKYVTFPANNGLRRFMPRNELSAAAPPCGSRGTARPAASRGSCTASTCTALVTKLRRLQRLQY